MIALEDHVIERAHIASFFGGTSPIIRSLAVKSTRVDNNNTMERTNEFTEK